MNTTTLPPLQPATLLHTSNARPPRPADVVASLSYLQPSPVRPFSYTYTPPPGVPWENCAYDERATAIADARSAAARPHIDREGFELWDAPSAVRDFRDDAAIKSIYYPEAAELALAVTGACRAYVFDHLVRRREPDRAALSFGRRGADGRPGSNGRIHNDYTEASGRKRLGLVLTDSATDEYADQGSDASARLRVRRYAIVNIWRSIKGPVLDTPLAVCDARSVMAMDLVEAEVLYPRRTGEIYLALHSPLHRWSYYPAMDRHEALVFKQFDSQISGVARMVPHAAFDHPHVPADAPLRESIELRCLVVYA